MNPAADLLATAEPELVVEFAETLSTFWRRERASYTTQRTPDDMLYLLLDSLAGVVLGGW